MTFAFINLGTSGIILIIIILLAFALLIGNYGRNTALGYWGSVLLALFTGPLIAYVMLYIIKPKQPVNI